ncbi:hypothetical protein [Haloarchaeobius sp. DFWS5]|uniref:hypothetical protein n=1 Tax=Haloarchaeobius sp. DFWS5 TaxID=3446114 RepID=UPI003EB75787
MHRRNLLSGVVAVTTVSITGCLSDSSSNAPDSETDPATLLPPEGDGWEIETQQQWDASQLHENADAAVNAHYSGPDGGSYRIVIVQWGDDPTDPDVETAEAAIEGDVISIIRTGSVSLIATSIDGTNTDALINRSDTFHVPN